MQNRQSFEIVCKKKLFKNDFRVDIAQARSVTLWILIIHSCGELKHCQEYLVN